ncbi:tRNA (adenosine(37)-N6)-threonylcarbamoyltransferase complex ATPase subunit type 1 TsaE [Legionella dresdenensis]|uniref:tRNA threonylcarbamoyladenosine biosynthesis protein TsaE n=1 Tax=Legionella dresdenensis TaxID=450200 RepID=A0ABV8CF49_9GAMM
MTLEIELPDEDASNQLATVLAACLQAPAVITFAGEIGAGKTTLIRAMLRALGVTSAIKSPTFSLVESYQIKNLHIHHFDLYRIQDEAELEYIGFRDYFNDSAVCCLEWPERAVYSLAETDLRLALTMQGNGRLLKIDAASAIGEKILACLVSKQ